MTLPPEQSEALPTAQLDVEALVGLLERAVQEEDDIRYYSGTSSKHRPAYEAFAKASMRALPTLLAHIAGEDARVAAAVAGERERAALICEQYSEVNMEICGDSVLLDPILHGGEWSSENVKRSEDCQIKGTIHSAHHCAARNLAAAIRETPSA
ncbi:hypothetical protein GCM10008023_06180 [Sphingomonas glacialis]|uniref:DUF2383 domain-containing protein n=1 Tax=Sphingomonas glacialis TaxID=658225 RepID=A0ABQ3L9E4_9SPHN|nr:hypothetical protein [Sphingomonas glacialis]GHH09465.1 hypothetical protein GCM10008023_06180 [Sphingomonas glacialis]